MAEREDALERSVRRQLDRGYRLVQDLNGIDDLADQLGSNYDDYLKETTEALADRILQAERSLRLLIETRGAPSFLADFMAAMEETGRMPEVNHHADDSDLPFNPALDEIARWTELIAPPQHVLASYTGERSVLRNLLHHLPQMMTMHGKAPTREHDVQVWGHQFLQLAFPDAVRESAVPQPAKTYKPDIGIGSIETAIELKFVDSDAEAKKALDELLTDMHGFNGSRDYSAFFGVIYMTGPHLSQQVLQAHLDRVGSPKSWETFVVIGAGGRLTKTRKAATQVNA